MHQTLPCGCSYELQLKKRKEEEALGAVIDVRWAKYKHPTDPNDYSGSITRY